MEEAYALGRELFGMEFIDAIPLESEVAQLKGIAFVTEQPIKSSGRRRDHVYLKGMLPSDQIDHLLPAWAFFTRARVKKAQAGNR